MFFDGKYKSKQNISLRGSSKNQQKEELLLKAQLERQERELQKKRNKAAVIIQSFYRGKRTKHHQRIIQREFFDSEIIEYQNQRSEVLANKLLQRFLYFHQFPTDEERLVQILQLYTHFLSNFQLLKQISSILSYKRLLLICFQNLSSSSIKNLTAQHISDFINIILFDESKSMDIEWKNFRAEIVYYLCSHNLLEQITKYWIDNVMTNPISENEYSKFLLKVIEEISKPLIEQNQHVSKFIFQIFTVPQLPTRLGTNWTPNFQNSIEFSLSYLKTYFDQQIQNLGNDNQLMNKTLYLLANLLAFGKIQTPKMKLTSQIQYLQLIHKIICHLPQNYFNFLTNSLENEEGQDYHEQKSPKIDSSLMKSLQSLFSSEFLSPLLRKSDYQMSTSSQEEKLWIITLFSFYSTLVFHFQKMQFDLLNILVFENSGKVVTNLWKFCQSDKHFPLLLKQNFLHSPNPSFWLPFCLFLASYGHMLITLGDEEFLAQTILTIEEVNQLISILKTIIAQITMSTHFSSNTIFIETITHEKFKLLIVKLLKQLHDRDSRNKFCPPDHWVVQVGANLKNLSPQFFDMFDQISQIETVPQNITNDEDEDEDEELPDVPVLSRHQSSSSISISKMENIIVLLKNVPFLISFDERIALFRQLIDREKDSRPWRYGEQIEIDRDNVFESGFRKLNPLGNKLKQKIQIQFTNSFGVSEAGIDGGGLFKEFMNELIHQGFNPNYGLFNATANHHLYPNPTALAANRLAMSHYEFLGRMLGKALYEGILVELRFAGFFLNKILGRNNYLDDLASLDEEMYKNLLFVKHYQGNVEDLALDFTLTINEFGNPRVVELVPGGKSKPVTNSNKMVYIYYMSYYKLNTQIRQASEAFMSGLSDIINPDWLKMFDQGELQTMISGADRPINFDDLRANTVYQPEFSDDHPVIQMFWKVVNSLSEEEKGNFLQFVTSCSRPPLLGFKELVPKFSIQPSGTETDRLPTASTCFNLLKIPLYQNEKQLRDKLKFSINSKSGFELS